MSYKIGSKVLVVEKGARHVMDKRSKRGKRKCYMGTVIGIDGAYTTIKPYWANWELWGVYPNEFKVIKE
jgi:hypothetical protein